MTRSTRGLIAVAAALCLGLTACGAERRDSTPQDEAPAEFYEPGIYDSPDAGEPVSGGTLTFAEYAEGRSMDPTKVISTGSSGANAHVAVYDQLVRWNEREETYEPRLAESIESNDDHTEWTIKLREGVTFSNGTPLDADAVLGSFQYYFDNNGSDAAVIQPVWDEAVKVDDATIVIKLTGSWASFPFALGKGLGFILAPEAIAGGPDAFKPIGAGAFVFDSYRPQEELVLKANPDYWDGAPHLDTVRFVWFTDDETKLDSLQSGNVQVGTVNDVQQVEEARQDDTPGWVEMQNTASLIVPSFAEGRPGSNLTVRQAVAHAIDEEGLAQRVYEGNTVATKHLFAPTSPWYADDVEVAEYDPEKAAQLLDEAKADGYDGKFTLTSLADPTGREQALAIGAYLEAVGFEVEYDFKRTVADIITTVFVQRDYEFARSAFNIGDRHPYWNLQRNFYSQSGANSSGFNDPEMDALIEELRATEQADLADVTHRIEERFAEIIPAISLQAAPMMTFWNESVHGINPTNHSMVGLEKAWIAN